MRENFLRCLSFPTLDFRLSTCRRGMSLLELLIYIAILSGLMVVVSDAFLTLSKGRGQAEARSEVNATLRFAQEKIRQDIKNATTVNVPVSGTASSTLDITVGGVSVVYNILQGQVWRNEGVATSTAITGTEVYIYDMNFNRVENYNSTLAATTTAVQTAMSARYNATSTDWTYSDSLRTTVTLR